MRGIIIIPTRPESAQCVSRYCIVCGYILTNSEPIHVLCFEEFVIDADIIKILSQIPTSNKAKSSLIIGGCVEMKGTEFFRKLWVTIYKMTIINLLCLRIGCGYGKGM